MKFTLLRKVICNVLVASFLLFAFNTSLKAQNNLSAGDLAFVSYQADTDPTNTFDPALLEFDDRFSLVVLKPGGLTAGSVIYITSRGWDGPNNIWLDEAYPPFTFGIGSEAVIKWVVPAGGIIQGKEVFFINKYHDELAPGSEYFQWFAYSDESGTIPLGAITNESPIVPTADPQPNGFTDGMSLYQSGGNILVFQTGPPAGAPTNYDDPTRRFITAILANIRPTNVGTPTSYAAWDVAPNVANESSIPPGLLNGQTCFLMSPGPLPQPTAPVSGTVEPDNGKFSNCTLSSAAGICTALQMSTIIYNTANWTYQNTVFAVGTSSSLCTYNFSPASTVTLSSAAGTNAQTVCINTPITDITYNTTGATGATITGLPVGVSGLWAANVVTITGTPTVAGPALTYTVTLIGGCGAGATTGTIAVSANNTAGSPSSNPTVCVNTIISPNITIATTGATGIDAPVGLPAGVTAAWAANVITISGTPTTTAGSPFNYSIPLTGGCGTVNATGTITINSSSIAPTSISGTTVYCNPGSTILTAVGGTLGTGANYQWGTGAVVGTAPLSGETASTLTVSPISTTTYWVRIENACNGNTAGVTQEVTVNQPSVVPTGATGTTTICSGGSTTLTVTGGSKGTGAVTEWFSGSCGGSLEFTGDAFTVSPGTTTTYYVRYSGDCNTTTCAMVTVTVVTREINVQGNSNSILDGDVSPSLTDHTDFGDIITGNSPSRTYTIQNTGTDNLTVSGITVTGANAGMFTVTTLTPASPIPGGGSATFIVTFTSTSTGLKTATVNIANNDCDEALYNFAIQANGTCVTDPVVTTNANSGPGSLRQAVLEACPGSTITFSGVTSPITLTTGEIGINKNLTINGPGSNLLSVSGSNSSRIFNITTGVSANINNLTITSGHATFGGGLTNTGTLALNNIVFSGNSVSASNTLCTGGGMSNSGIANLTNVVFSNNTAIGSGGAIHTGGSSGAIATFNNVVFSGNSSSQINGLAGFGGAVVNNGAPSTYFNCSFYGNSATDRAGAMYNVNYSAANRVQITNCIFRGNTAPLFADIDNTFNFVVPTSITTSLFGVDPLFVNAADPDGADNMWITGDDGLRLQIGSPAINTGTAAGAPATDILGRARLGNIDIGAYEFGCAVPIFSNCPGNQNANNSTGSCSAVVTYTATATGTPAPTITYVFTGATTGSGSGTGSGATFNVGVTTVTLTATNTCGAPTCSFTVKVVDNQAPTVTAGTIASCYPTVALAEAAALATTSATDNCPGKLSEIASTTGTCSAVITITTTDAAGNETAVTYNTRIDNTAPFVTVGTIASCYPTVAAAETAALAATSATDNCPGALTEIASTLGTCSAVVTVTTTDGCGNATAVTYNTRIDNTAPTVTVGTIGSCYPTVAAAETAALAATTATDNCPGTLSETASTVGTCSAVVTVTTTDGCGNATAVSYNTRIDNTAPTVTVGTIASCYSTVAAAETAALAATSATDNCPGTLSETASTVGTCSAVVTVTTIDGCGNATAVSYNTRIDNTAPTVTVGTIGSCYPTVAAAETAALAATTATDNCPGTLSETASTVGTCSAVVTVTTIDGCGNATAVSYNTRIDNTAPTVTVGTIGSCYPTVVAAETAALAATTATDNCPGTLSKTASTVGTCSAVVTVTTTDGCGNATAVSYNTRIDNTPPVITAETVNPSSLWPPNHKMRDVYVGYTANDNCGTVITSLSVISNEPPNGTGDGDIAADFEIVDNHNVRLRAERAGIGNGRVYTITIRATDACGNSTSKDVTVRVTHNITSPVSGNSFKVGSTVSFSGVFWDKPGNTHTGKWLIDGSTLTNATITEPTGSQNGKSTGSYKFNTPGVYKLQMNITDQTGVTSYASINGDLEAIVVIYDPNGGYTYGGGWYPSQAGALASNPSATGKANYGFTVNYTNATNPKGESQFELKVGTFEFNALNFDYLVIQGAKATFRGTGKIIGGQSGIGFIMTVIDGALDGTGVDKVRMKIFNKTTNVVYYDNQPGASDASNPVTPVGTNSIVVIGGTQGNSPTAKASENVVLDNKPVDGLEVFAYPNPTNNHFTIQVNAVNTKDNILLQVVDVSGRIVETRNNINAGTAFRLGDKYRPGSYLLRFVQGREHKEMKLIKLSE